MHLRACLMILLSVLPSIVHPAVATSRTDVSDNKTAASVVKMATTDNNNKEKMRFPVTDTVHHGSGSLLLENNQGAQTDDLRSQYPCGYPCDENEWCGMSQKRCRPCSDLDRFCSKILVIQQNYSSCVPHCYRLQEEETKKFKELYEKEVSAQQNCSMVLSQQKEELLAADDKDKKQTKEMDSQAKDLNQCLQAVKQSKEETTDSHTTVQWLRTAFAISIVLTLASIMVTVWQCLKNRKQKPSQRGQRELKQSLIGSSNQSNSSGADELKSPIQVDRISTHFPEEDEYCFAGRGGKAHAKP